MKILPDKSLKILLTIMPLLFTLFFIDQLKPHAFAAATLSTANDDIMACMNEYGVRKDITGQMPVVTQIYDLCYNIVRNTLVAREQMIKNDTYEFQRSENVVLMIMVVVITLSGVGLAAVQLNNSFKLAGSGRVSIGDEGGQLEVGVHRLSLRSSYVGVTILGISFAFFLVFVLYV
jgi:hypothetical protein